MAEKFVRNITDTNTGGNKINKNNEPTEPLYTNIQNDILSDDEDIYIRNQNEYVCLTDNVKEVETTNNIIGSENTDKNTVELKPQVATKTDAETGTSNGKIMTPLQTKNAIEYNNVNVIPDLVKTHETETEITSKSDNLTVTKTSKNNFELKVDIDNNDTDINVDDFNMQMFINSLDIRAIFDSDDNNLHCTILYNEDFFKKVKQLLEIAINDGVELYSPEIYLQTNKGESLTLRIFDNTYMMDSKKQRYINFKKEVTRESFFDSIREHNAFIYIEVTVNNVYYSIKKSNVLNI